MRRYVHGLASLVLVAASLAIALAVVGRQSPAWGGAYLALLVVGSVAVLWAYCAKCPCRETGCGHVIPGRLARLLPGRRQGPYTLRDYLGLTLPLGLMVIVPQVWLVKAPTAMLLFWLLLAAGVIDILVVVCKGCGNAFCVVRRLRN